MEKGELMKEYMDRSMIGELVPPLDVNHQIDPTYISNFIPTPTTADAGKFLRVGSNGKIVIETVARAEEMSF